MRQLILTLIIICTSGLFQDARANHIFGGELYYTHISGNTYKIAMTLYGDCGSDNPRALALLETAAPEIQILDGSIEITNISLAVILKGLEVTPVCPAFIDSTKCKSGTLPGVRKFVYETEYTFPYKSDQWHMLFVGNLANNSSAGRTLAITNVINPGFIVLSADLNNLNGPNNSPEFTTIPTPFYCINVPQEYNQGIIDADGDSLVFEMVPALYADAVDGFTGLTVIYHGQYSGVTPMSTMSGSFDFNQFNGQLKFQPNIVQNALVVVQTTEYRDGVKIGSSMREMTFIVLDNCQNLPPTGDFNRTSVSGALLDTLTNILYICEGAGTTVKFDYQTSDPDGDTIEISHTTIPPGAVLQVHQGNTPTTSFSFEWNTTGVPAGIYNFFVRLKDRHCPLNAAQTFGVTLRIVKPVEVTSKVIDPTQCIHKATLEFDIHYGVLPRTISLYKEGNFLRQYPDSLLSFIDSLEIGNYRMVVESHLLECITEYNFQVVDSGILPYKPVLQDTIACIGIEETLTAITFRNATAHWTELDGTILAGPPQFTPQAEGSYSWLAFQRYLTCNSIPDTLTITAFPQPVLYIENEAGPACVGDIVFLKHRGTPEVQWLPEEELFYEPDSSIFIRLYEPTTITAIGTSEFGCHDTATLEYPEILPCCNFSYPSAFTPNGDGRNDDWHPIMYGNQIFYELSIYNRWGERLFHSFRPNEGWDGTLRNQPQGTGAYFYVLRAKCLTGKEEVHKGEVMLIR